MLERHYFTGLDVSPRLAVSYTVRPGHVIRVGASQAYRSPTFFEEDGNATFRLSSGGVLDVVTVPSNGLEPERVRSREIAYLGRWPQARIEWDLRLYRDHIDNFIGQEKGNFVADGALRVNEFRFNNIGTVDTHGGEIQLRWRPTALWDVGAHYARVYLEADTTVNNFNNDIPLSAPRNSWGLLARTRFGNGWEASIGAWHYDDTKWLSEGDLVQNFTRIDLRLARRWSWQGREVEAAVVGQNLGEDYAEFRDTNIFSRRVYGSLSFAW
jgi:iron complex outermembrane receptor protein